MKKKLLLIPLTLLIVAVLVACAAPEVTPTPPPTPTPTITPTPTPTPSPPPEQMEPQKWLCVMFQTSLTDFVSQQWIAAFDRIKTRTNDLLSIEATPNGVLPIEQKDLLRAVMEGNLEMVMTDPAHHSGDYSLWQIFSTPFLLRSQVEKALVASAVLQPILQRDLNNMDVQLLAYIPEGPDGLWVSEKLDNLMDIKGLKIRAASEEYATIIEAINGEPIPIDWAETYTALQQGVVKGLITAYPPITMTKIHEVCPYAYYTGLSSSYHFLSANKEKWDALPDSIKVIVLEEIQLVTTTIQANIPEIERDEIGKQLATGLKEYQSVPPSGWFDLMDEKVAQPYLEQGLEKQGDAGVELITLMEQALGRKLVQ
jgi:TRAP-type C4-dicarboxylate transport system substrate-binding protein